MDSKPAPLDLPCLKPYIHTTQAILMHFSQSKSTKCEILAVCLIPHEKIFKMSILIGKNCLKRVENLHIQVFGCANHYALC